MRYEDASQISGDVTARDDTEHLAGNDFGPATGNIITGAGTVSGATGTDSGGSITAIAGAGGSDVTFDANGMLEVAGQYGTLTIDAEGNYTYVRAPGSPEGVNDTFTYTLANEAGATDTAELVIAIGNPPILQAQGTPTVLQNGNVVTLPPGVELSDVRVVGRDLVITLPDGSTMVIPDGAVFVPQLVVNGVEVPASNLAALLIDSEPRPAAGDATAAQQSSGGNFGLPPGPLDPGVPLGDLLPPTELDYTPPEVDELFDAFDNDPPVITPSSINVSDEGVDTVDDPIADNSGTPDTTNARIVNGHINVVDPDGDSVTLTLGEPSNALTSQGDPIDWSVSPDGHTVIGTAGGLEVIRIVIENDGDYTVTQSRPIDHPNTSIEDGVSFVVPVFATDGEDFAVPSTITVTIEDDSPVVENVTVRGGITLDETSAGDPDGFPIFGSTDGAIIVNSDGGFGADGEAAEDGIVYGLGLTGGVDELASGIQTAIGGHAITLVQVNSTLIEGRYNDGSAQVAFTIQMNGDGSVTLTQNVPLEHLVDGPPGPDHDDSLDLGGLVNATVTYTDFDGDSDTGSAPIGDALVFKDDGPDAGLEEGFQIPEFVLDESPAGEDEGGDNDPAGRASVTLDLSGAFTGPADFGADGEGDVDYALTLNGEDLGTGMFALDPEAPDGKGAEILLVDNGDGTISGVANEVTYFTISVDGDGNVTFEQSNNVWHGNTGSDDDTSFLSAAPGTIMLEQTVTDSDGDFDSAAIDLSDDVFQIEDDGPSVQLNDEFEMPTLVVDESPVGEDEGGDNDPAGVRTATFDFSDAFGESSFGTDGPGSVEYGLALSSEGAGSGLFALGVGGAQGDEILLFTEADGSITGRTGDENGPIYFTISVVQTGDDAGEVTFEQSLNVWHGDDSSDDDTSFLSAEAGTITLEQTVTDADGDSETVGLDLSDDVFAIEDDGPSGEDPVEPDVPTLVVDESPVGEDEGGDNDPAGVRTDTASFAALFGAVDYGTDGPGTVEYGLELTSEGAESGLFALGVDGAQGDAILLFTEADGSITGRTGDETGPIYFTISVVESGPGAGDVTFEQELNVWHADDTSDDDTSTLNAEPGTILLNQVVTDADGDTDGGSIDLSAGVFNIEDDGPSTSLNEQFEMPVLTVDESPVGEDEGGDNDPAGVRTATFDFSVAFGAADFGTDGPGTVEYGLVLSSEGAESGLFALGVDGAQGDAILLFTEADGSITGRTGDADGPIYFTISVVETGVDAGEVTFEQSLNVWHADDTSDDDTSFLSADPNTITLEQTVTDADGDTETVGLDLSDDVFAIEDDGPTGDDPVRPNTPDLVVDESPVGEDEEGDNDPAGVRTDTASFAALFGAVDYGTDGPGTVEYSLSLSSEGAESGLFALGVDGAQGDAILLFTEADGSITGRTGDADGPIYFTISVVETGAGAGDVTFEQELNVWHADDTSDDDTSTLTADPGTILLNQVVTDADGDTDGGSIDLSTGVFHIEDDGPSAELDENFEMPVLTVDESPVGEDEGGDNDPAGVRTATFDFSAAFGTALFGTDGPGTVEYGLVLSTEGAESGLFALGVDGAQGDAILLFTEADGSITGRTGDATGPIYFTISVVETGVDAGEVTFEQELNVWHADDTSDDDTSTLSAADGTILLEQTATDADGDTESVNIDLSDGVFAIEDDGPSASLDESFEMPVLTVDESPVGEDEGGDNDPAGVRTATFDFSAAFGAADFGTDGPGTVEYGLSLSSEGAESGLFALGVDGAQGDAILLFTEADGSITGRTGDADGPIYFTISVVETGVDAGEVTFEQELNVWHADDTSDDDTSTLSAADGTITLEQTVTDADGDTETVGLDLSDGVFAIEDDGPTASLDEQFEMPILTVDESPVGEDEGGDNDPAGVRTATFDFSVAFGASSFGTDGAGTVAYALTLSDEGAESGLFALGDNNAQGDAILLFTEPDGSITGRTTDGGPIYFTISVEETGVDAGEVTFEQEDGMNVWHADDTSDDDTSTLVADAGTITLEQTVTDADGDTETVGLDLSDGVFAIEDDGPAITDVSDAQGDNTGPNPSAEGTFAFDIGTDRPNTDHDDIFIDPDTFVVSINGTPVDPSDVTFGEAAAGEDEHTAEYEFSFTYPNGDGTTDTRSGTLIFYKDGSVPGHAAGTYEVVLDGPIQGFTLLDLNGIDSDDFVEHDAPGQAGGSPEIVVAPFGENLFVQFTGFARATNGSNTLQTDDWDQADPTPPAEIPADINNQWAAGDLFTDLVAGMPSVTVSENDAGVAGNTIQTGEVIDFNLYSSDPGANLGLTPSASSPDMFILFDNFAADDDLIVILKLMDADTGEFTTKAVVVNQGDYYMEGDEALLAGTAYEGIINDPQFLSNDSLLIIESNDYNTEVGDNWVIVGAQVTNHHDGVSGSGINLNRLLGEDGASSGTELFSTDTDTSNLKISNIGFLTSDTTDQSATFEFDVTVTDADGDTETESILVQIGDPPAEGLMASTMETSRLMADSGETSSFSLLASETTQLEKTAANSNNVVLAAAIGAAGFAATGAAAHPAHFDVGGEFVTNAIVGREAFGFQGLDAAYNSPAFELGNAWDGGFQASFQALSGASHTAIAASHIGELSANLSLGSGPNALLEATDFGAMLHMPALATTMDVAMASADSLMPQLAGVNAQTTGAVEQILADALQGGGSAPNIDALLDGLPGGGIGEIAGLHQLASRAGEHVPAWDMGHGGGFTFDVASIITSEAMVLHHDAVQPVANG